MHKPDEWAEAALAAGLQPGRKLRMHCTCGDGRTLLVTHHGNGLHGYCFREKESRWHALTLSLAEKLAARRAMMAAERALADTPLPPQSRLNHPHDWPPQYRTWLYDAGINDDDSRRLGFGYHQPSGRLILPFMEWTTGRPGWVGRSQTAQPKYLFPSAVSRNAGAVLGGTPPPPWADVIALTEDLLSQYRVARAWERVGIEGGAVAIMGTSLSREMATHIAARFPGAHILVMLDPDKHGQRGARKAAADLARYGLTASVYQTTRDPKYMTDEELVEVGASHT